MQLHVASNNTTSNTSNQPTAIRFLDLSPELRNSIYDLVYPTEPAQLRIHLESIHKCMPTPALALACRKIYRESFGHYSDAISSFWHVHVLFFKFDKNPKPQPWPLPLVLAAYDHARYEALGCCYGAAQEMRRAIRLNPVAPGFFAINFDLNRLPRVAKIDEMLASVAGKISEAEAAESGTGAASATRDHDQMRGYQLSEMCNRHERGGRF